MQFTPVKFPNPQAHTRLYCFPYAGGNAQVFSTWHKLTSKNIEIVAVQYPGRSERFREPAIDDCLTMANAIANEIDTADHKPFALLGYSMGGIIAYETLRHLKQTPKALFLCASHPPQPNNKQRHQKNDAELAEDIKKLGGIDARLLEDPEMRSLIVTMMRSDFRLIDTYQALPQHLTCPTHIIYGANDPHVTPQTAKQWESLCKGTLYYHKIPGDHFFLRSHRELLVSYIQQQLDTRDESHSKASTA